MVLGGKRLDKAASCIWYTFWRLLVGPKLQFLVSQDVQARPRSNRLFLAILVCWALTNQKLLGIQTPLAVAMLEYHEAV